MPRLNKEQTQKLIEDIQSKQFQDKELSDKYQISIQTVQNHKKKIKSNNTTQQSIDNQTIDNQTIDNQTQSIDNQSQSQNYTSATSSIATKQSIDQSQNDSLIVSQKEYIDNDVQFDNEVQQLDNMNNTLIDLLNKSKDNQEIIIQDEQQIIKPIKQKQKQVQQEFSFISQQPIVQPPVLNGDDEQKQRNTLLMQIRKYISNFIDEKCIHSLIGSSDKQQKTFISKLQGKSIEELKSIKDGLTFELKLSRQSDLAPDFIIQSLSYIEIILNQIGIDVQGCAQEMFQDQDMKFYLKMVSSELTYDFSPSQIIFFKMLRSYYTKYYTNKQNKIVQSKLQKNVKLDDKWKQI